MLFVLKGHTLKAPKRRHYRNKLQFKSGSIIFERRIAHRTKLLTANG